jgi:hypothetical protein
MSVECDTVLGKTRQMRFMVSSKTMPAITAASSFFAPFGEFGAMIEGAMIEEVIDGQCDCVVLNGGEEPAFDLIQWPR